MKKGDLNNIVTSYCHDIINANNLYLPRNVSQIISREFNKLIIKTELYGVHQNHPYYESLKKLHTIHQENQFNKNELISCFTNIAKNLDEITNKTEIKLLFSTLSIIVLECSNFFPDSKEMLNRYEGTLVMTSDKKEKIFIVHGNDPNNYRHEIARFIEKEGYEAIILSEMPNRGMAIIEKLERNSISIKHCVVIMTPDDEGRRKGGELMDRSRQNVIFELGYFIGFIGRSHVSCLVYDNIEMPTDYHGVVYVDTKQSNWRDNLGKELNAN